MKSDENVMGERNPYSLELRGWYRMFRGAVRFLVRLLARVEVIGEEHIPDEGPYLYVANHLHWLDPPLLMAFFPHRAFVFAAEKWESHWFFGPIFRSLDGIFINRGEVDRKALRQGMAVLKGGGILGLAPEGTRSRTGSMQRGRSGAAYIAYRAGVRILPAVVTGQENVFPALWRFRRAKVRIVYGPPFDPPSVKGKAKGAQIHAFAEGIMYRLAAMLPPEYRGVYADVAEVRPDLMALYAVEDG